MTHAPASTPDKTQDPPALKVISGLGDPVHAHPGKPAIELDPRAYSRSLDCVHCGLCLPACPTYTQNGLEADSPRGRIVLMKGIAEGTINPTDSVINHLDLCLDCQACETACPSGVVYHELLEETRAKLGPLRKKTLVDRLMNRIFLHLFPYPARLKLALLPARILQRLGWWKPLLDSRLGGLMPSQLRKMNQMLPEGGPLWEPDLLPRYPATANRLPDGSPRAVVALFAGCVGSVLFQEVNRKTIRILQHIGCDVVVPHLQECCGAIPHHIGEIEKAQAMARANIDVFHPVEGKPVADFIVNNIAGCGAGLKHFDHLLQDDPAYAKRAVAFVERNRDIAELLVELNPPRPTHRVERTVTYHHACHLVHAQKLAEPPLQVLRWIEGLTIKPLVEADMCCGAAGTYNLAHPEMASDLGERKVRHIENTAAATCVTGNVGCAMQIQSEAQRLSAAFDTTHPVSLLHEAYFGPET